MGQLIRKYMDLQIQINRIAAREVEPLERKIKKPTAALYWNSVKLRRQSALGDEPTLRKISRHIKNQFNTAKNSIRESVRERINISIESIASILAISAGMLVLSSYLRTMIIFSWFNIDYGSYFAISDYISNGITEIDNYALTLLACGLYYIWMHSENTASKWVVSNPIDKNDRRELFNEIPLHLIGISGIIVTLLYLFQFGELFSAGIMVSIMYISTRILRRPEIYRIFDNPAQAATILVLLSLWAAYLISGTIAEIDDLQAPPKAPRAFHFGDLTISEENYALLSVTSDLYIFRRYDGSDLKILSQFDLDTIEVEP